MVTADCLRALPRMAEGGIDVIITDPPYGLGIGGMAWDGSAITAAARPDLFARGGAGGSAGAQLGGGGAFQAFCAAWAAECLRVLKPGGHLAAFGAPRTAHRLACGVEQAGFELRDTLMWLYAQGMPKSHNLSGGMRGWGTGLRPSYEPILLARKPLDGHTRANAERHGTGALHIDACRIAHPTDGCPARTHSRGRAAAPAGRWPANVMLSHHSTCGEGRCEPDCPGALLGAPVRFFYCAKANRRERDAGCDSLPRRAIQTYQIGTAEERRAREHLVGNVHPTVKPIELMRWLVRLLTPVGGVVLDPFAGSGSTGAAAVLERARFLGIEREAEYVPIARARIGHWATVARRGR